MTRVDKNNNITHSYGDMLAINIHISKPLEYGETLVFGIKGRHNEVRKNIELENIANLENYVVVIDSKDMIDFPVGDYEYDIAVKQHDGNLYTILPIKKLVIVEVAHNV